MLDFKSAWSLFILLLAASPGSMATEPADAAAAAATEPDAPTRVAPASQAVSQAELPRYLQSRSAHFVDWLADGSMLIRTRFGETEQVHRLRMPAGMREQMTFADGGVRTARARPGASDALIYLEPLHGGQTLQLVLQRLDNHERRALTNGQYRDEAPLWAHDGHHLVFASNRVNEADTQIYEIDTGTAAAAPKLLAGGTGVRWRPFDWSSDDKRLLLGREADSSAADGATGIDESALDDRASETQLFVVDVDSGEASPVTLASGTGRHSSNVPVRARDARFAADGHGIVALTDHTPPEMADGGSERPVAHLIYLDSDSADSHHPPWHSLGTASTHDVERFDQSLDGRYLAYSYDDKGTDRLMLLDQQRKLDVAITQIPPGRIGRFGFDPSGQRLAVSVESARAPADVYVYELQSSLATPWTRSEVGPTDPDHFVSPEAFRFPTWDRTEGGQERQLMASIYRAPVETAMASPRPVLIWLCPRAGARCQSRFNPFVQCLVNELGWVVLVPTVRGSSEDAVRDVGSLLVWIGLRREFDRDRVALLGEGFGGYLTLQSLADYGDRLRGGVAAFAPHGSALAHSPAVRRPLLLVQGLSNPAAPAYELEQLQVRLRTQGVEVQLLEAADEGAQFERKSDRDAYLSAAADFLVRVLR